MEPIRPDDDELRATAGKAGPRPPASDGRKNRAAPAQDAAGAGGRAAPAHRSGGGALYWLVLLVVTGAGLAGWYLQQQRLDALQAQLEEADYWARQSKLALARFEGELSETGENLQERGQTLEARIADNHKQLEAANSEIRKLWVVANERNKARLDALDSGLAEARASLAAVRTDHEQRLGQLKTDLAALSEQVSVTLADLDEASRQTTDQLASLSQRMAEVDQVVDSRLRRFEQEQKLTLSGLESRLAALEKRAETAAGSKDVRALRDALSSLDKTVQAIDASRAQLTSRLVRLSDRLDRLEARVVQ